MECVARKRDPAGFPDFTYPVTIKAMTIESLAVDIKAQTIPALKVDISAQSLPALSVNIVACAATLNVNILSQSVAVNVKTAVGEHVDTDIISSVTLPINIVAQTITTLAVDIKAQSVGNLNVNIAASAVTLNVNVASQSVSINVKTAANEHVDTDIVSSVTLPINIVAQTITTLGVDIKAQTVGNLNVNIAASAVTLNVAIQSTAVTLPVSIQSSAVAFDVNIVSQAVDINVKTSSGANIVIDKLTQSAYTERRSVLQNNGASAFLTGFNKTVAKGKFFPRGCRGFIGSVEIYCENSDTVAHVFTIHFAPMPGMGDVFNVVLSVPASASAAWRSVAIYRMWNYDSMFIWVECDDDSYGRLGYDLDAPYDAYTSTDRMVWTQTSHRYWFRVNMAGETVGDLPVSGTINTIAIPNVLSDFKAIYLATVPHGGGTYDVLPTIHGAGAITCLQLTLAGVPCTDLELHIVIDGVDKGAILRDIGSSLDNTTTAFARVTTPTWNPTWNRYSIAFMVDIHFRRSARIYVKNTHPSYDADLYSLVMYELIK